MAWYRTGTVSVTNGSASVTGAGTSWFGGLQAGWGFVGPDGRTYEIADVVDATSLTLATPYQGSTAAAQNYAAFPTMSLAGDLTAELQALTSEYQGVVDGAGAGKFPDGTLAEPGVRFEADPDTGLRRVGANSAALVGGGVDKLGWSGSAATGDIVQADPLDATAGRLLKVGAFGLGKDAGRPIVDTNTHLESGFFYGLGGAHPGVTPGDNPFPSVSGAFGLVAGNSTLGDEADYRWQMAVRLSADTPEAVFRSSVTDAGGWSDWAKLWSSADAEFGSNGNGSYVRFPDGTQICWHNFFTANNAAVTWTFPAAFVDTNVTCIPVSGFETGPRIMGQSVPTATSVNIRSFDETGSENVAPRCQIWAAGRWN